MLFYYIKNPCWFWGEMGPGRVFSFLFFFTHSGSCLMDVQLKEARWWWFCIVNDGWWKQWLFSGRLSEITDLIERAFLIYSHQKKKKELLLTMFPTALFLCFTSCESWRISAKLLCYLGSFPRTPFPLHFFSSSFESVSKQLWKWLTYRVWRKKNLSFCFIVINSESVFVGCTNV